jgi:ATP-binding cassette subfamily B protein
MRKIRPVRQHDTSDCGAACLCSIARSFGYDLPLARIRELACTGPDGTNVLGLVEAAGKMGFLARGIRGPAQSLKAAPLPSIAHIETKDKRFHYVVLTGINPKSIRYMDPASGNFKRVAREEFVEMWTGVLIVMVPGAGFSERSENRSLAGRLMDLARPFRAVLLESFAGAILYSLLGLSTSFFVQKIIDNVLVNQNINLLNLLAIIMILLLIIRILISWYKNLFLLKTGQQVDAGLLMGYYRHLLSLPQQFFDSMKTGEILSRINDAIKIRVFLNRNLIDILVSILSISITLTVMAILSWKLSLLVLPVLPVYFLLYLIIDRINKKVLRGLMEHSANLESQLVESIHYQRSIRTFVWKDWSAGLTSRKIIPVLQESYRAGKAALQYGHFSEFVGGLMTILLLWKGTAMVIAGELSPGELMSFFAMLTYLLNPLSTLGSLNSSFRDAWIATDRLFQVLDLETEKNTEEGVPPENLEHRIEFSGVSFRYGNRPELFRDLSFSIPAGKLTGVIGPSGSGKSSIASLLLAEYMPGKGNIRFDNHDIQHLDRKVLRYITAIVPQRIELYSGSILENIAPGQNPPDYEKLLRVCRSTGLDRLIADLPEGFNTRIGENGKGLSGGEKQRIALARALYREPEILILDEPTSALDPASEAEILELLHSLRNRKRTIILITHKLNLVKDADHLILIERGACVASGKHEDLMQRNGQYMQMWTRQHLQES